MTEFLIRMKRVSNIDSETGAYAILFLKRALQMFQNEAEIRRIDSLRNLRRP